MRLSPSVLINDQAWAGRAESYRQVFLRAMLELILDLCSVPEGLRDLWPCQSSTQKEQAESANGNVLERSLHFLENKFLRLLDSRSRDFLDSNFQKLQACDVGLSSESYLRITKTLDFDREEDDYLKKVATQHSESFAVERKRKRTSECFLGAMRLLV